MILLPLIAYALFAVLWLKAAPASLRVALVRACVSCFACVAVFTEAASSGRAVTVEVIAGAWAAVVAILGGLCWRGRNAPMPDWRARLQLHWPGERWLWLAVALILSLTALTAWLYPPNNWDSLTYHMARVAAWNQQHSADFFATAIPRQNWQMPLAEFAIWHSMLLAGSDEWANLVQWSAFAHAVLLASLIAARLGATPRGQARAALLAATVPMAILQSSSTQTDVVAACLCMAFAETMLAAREDGRLRQFGWAGVCMGLALLTKGTSFFLIAAFGLGLGAELLRPAERLRTVGKLAVTVLIGVAWCAPFFVRNFAAHGRVFAPEGAVVWNADTSAPAIAASAAKHLASNLTTPFGALNDLLAHAVRGAFGAAADSPGNAWPNAPFTLAYSQHEDLAANALHLALAACALGAAWVGRRRLPSVMWAWFGALLAGAVLVGALLRWNPWITRLHVPLILAATPWMAVALAAWPARCWVVLQTVLLVGCVPFLLENETRPLIGLTRDSCWNRSRAELYFSQHPLHRRDYVRAISHLRDTGVGEVGLLLGEDDPEYLLRVLAKNPADADAPPAFRHVGVVNDSRRLERADAGDPPFVLASRPLPGGRLGRSAYTVAVPGRVLVVYRRADFSGAKSRDARLLPPR